MLRALRIVKTIAGVLAIEIFVPGGTLIVAALLLTGRCDSPILGRIGRRVPALSRAFPWLTSRGPRGGGACA